MSSSEGRLEFARRGVGLFARTAIVAGVLLLEKSFLNLFVDFASAQSAQGLGAVVRVTQHWGFRFLVSFGIALVLFAYLRSGRQLQDVDAAARAAPLQPRWLLAHLLLFAPLVPLSGSLYGNASALPLSSVVVLWLLLAMLATAALFLALAPWAMWRKAIHALRDVWGYSAIAAAAGASAMGWSQGLWRGTARVTFEVVSRLLGRFMPALQVDSENRVIDTGRFAVAIDPVCSGLEGMGLMLAFCIVLLLLFRREFIFPRALLIVPAGLLLSFMLNIARIAGLVLIGDAGYAGVAVYGFHSQAGWIAFNAAAVGIALVTLCSSWFNRAAAARNLAAAGENPTAVYLLPYMALLLAGMVGRAASDGFERFDWLRLVFAGGALWHSWPRLRGVDWGFSWRGVLAGIAAFVLWITAARLMLTPHGMPPALAALPSSWSAVAIFGYVLATVGIVPVVEELAFRGYLLRRVHAAEFESSSPQMAGALGLIVSTAAFALCQGALWLPGIMAGIVFGVVYMRTGRLGEAIAAHLTGNALTAAAALAGYQGRVW